MKVTTTIKFEELPGDSQYLKLLKEEDFDFRGRDIKVTLKEPLNITLTTDSILNLKIGITSIIKSLEVISKTKKIIENGNNRRDN